MTTDGQVVGGAELEQARSALARDPLIGRFVRQDVSIPSPYVGRGNIRLVIIGQDPTVRVEATLLKIDTVLNLNRRGPLLVFVAGLCHQFGLSTDNVYATNACKNHFTCPPADVQDSDILNLSSPYWLPVLTRELAHFPQAAVISLGQPVLSMLVRPGYSREMKQYWGYHRRWQEGYSNRMRFIAADESTVGRRIFPFVHQPTIRGQRTEFYRVKRDEYLDFIRRNSGVETN